MPFAWRGIASMKSVSYNLVATANQDVSKILQSFCGSFHGVGGLCT